MAKTVADYPDAVRRIVAADVPADATTEADVERALKEANQPQFTSDVIEGMVDGVLTEERVRDAIQNSGELPSENEISRFADASDDYDLDDRVAAVSDAVADDVATVEQVDRAVRERQEQAGDRPMFREDVEGAVDSVSEEREFVGASPDDVADEQARDLGAPSRTNYERAAAQTVAQADSVTPSDVVEGTGSKTPVQVIRGESGEPVAATGGPGGEVSRQVADEIGAEYMSADEVTSEMRTAGSGDRVDLTLRGRKIGEVDV